MFNRSLTIVTESWKTIQYDEFQLLDIHVEEDVEEGPEFSIVGVFDIEEGEAMILCTAEDREGIQAKYNQIIYALDSGKPLVDFRRPYFETLDILKNARHRPGSERN